MASAFETRTLIHLLPEFLAPLLDYPDDRYHQRLRRFLDYLKEEDSGHQAIRMAQELIGITNSVSTEHLQEIYTSTFELSGATNLYASIHLFGEENFKRSMLMARMIDSYQEATFVWKQSELPDFVPTLLRFATHLGPCTKTTDLINELIAPTIRGALERLTEKESYPARSLQLALETLSLYLERTIND